MKLAVLKRPGKRKSDVTSLRHQGFIPAVCYGKGAKSELIQVKEAEIAALIRPMQSQLLATTVVELEEGGKIKKALIKEIQYHPVNYKILHIDFQLLVDDVPVEVNVPIELVGVNDCVGVKLGGFIRQVIRFLKVKCLPRDLPKTFPIDVLHLGLGEAKKLSDIAVPASVTPLAKMEEVAVLIAKKA